VRGGRDARIGGMSAPLCGVFVRPTFSTKRVIVFVVFPWRVRIPPEHRQAKGRAAVGWADSGASLLTH